MKCAVCDGKVKKDDRSFFVARGMCPECWERRFVLFGGFDSGRAYDALALAEKLDPDFVVSKIVFSTEELTRLLREVKDGSTIVFQDLDKEWERKQRTYMDYVMGKFRRKKRSD